MNSKTCIRCKKVLPVIEFHRDKRCSSGRIARCRRCTTKAAKRRTCRRCKEDKRVVDFFTGGVVCKQCHAAKGQHWCSKCQHLKPVDKFAKDPSRTSAPHSRHCKACQSPRWKEYYVSDSEGHKSRARERYRQNKEEYRIRATLRKFNIDRDTYTRLMADSNNVCAICQKPSNDKRNGVLKRLNIDHNHSTGKVRGLLCQFCNTGIGMFLDNIELLAKAINYLEKHNK